MSRLTTEAKEYCREALEAMGRDSVVEMLEGICIACYDDEETELLVSAAVESVECGDIEFDFSMGQAKALGHHTYMKWLDIEDVWE